MSDARDTTCNERILAQWGLLVDDVIARIQHPVIPGLCGRNGPTSGLTALRHETPNIQKRLEHYAGMKGPYYNA